MFRTLRSRFILSHILPLLLIIPLMGIALIMSQELLRPFYAAADAVLANSGHEPFGLVGLEARWPPEVWCSPGRPARSIPWVGSAP